MNALVAQVAAAIIPKPMPVVMDRAILGAVAARRDQRRRAAPQVVVYVIGHRLRTVGLANARPALVTETARDLDFAEVTRADPFDRLFDALAGTALRAGLDDFAMFARGFDRLAPFPDVVGNGLFHIDILARLHRPDRGERMPMIGRGDGDGVHVLVLQQPPNVRVGFHLFVALGKGLNASIQDFAVHVAQSDDPDIFAGEAAQARDVIATAPAESNH